MWWNNVETKPYGGYPQFWDVKLLNLMKENSTKPMVWNDSAKDGLRKPYGEYEGETIFEAARKRYGPEGNQVAIGYIPTDKEWRAPNIYEDTSTKYEPGELGINKEGSALPEHKTWFFYLQRICNHCSYPACLASCPRKASG